MVRIVSYLQAHHWMRAAMLVVSFVAASFALCAGVAISVLPTGMDTAEDGSHERFVAVCGLVVMVANVLTPWVLAYRGGSFLRRFVLSVIVTMGGAILVFGLIVVR